MVQYLLIFNFNFLMISINIGRRRKAVEGGGKTMGRRSKAVDNKGFMGRRSFSWDLEYLNFFLVSY